MSVKINSNDINSFLSKNSFKEQDLREFKKISKAIVRNIHIFPAENLQKYQEICLKLKKVCKDDQKIDKWQKIVVGITELRRTFLNSSLDFQSLSQGVIQHLHYLQPSDLASFRKICNGLEASQDQTVQAWRQILGAHGLKIHLNGSEVDVPPAVFRKDSFLQLSLKDSVANNVSLPVVTRNVELTKKALQNPAEIIITEENVWDVLEIADYYKINSLKKAVVEFGKTMSQEEHLLNILFYSNQFHLEELYHFHFAVLEKMDDESLEPILNSLLEIAKTNQDTKLASFLFSHARAIKKPPTDPLIQSSASLLTKIEDKEWKLLLPILSYIRLDHVREINFSTCTDSQLKELLEKCPNVQKINLNWARVISGEAFTCNVRFEQLTEISFWGCWRLTDNHLKTLLEKAPKLQKICLDRTQITGAAFAFSPHEHLKEINFYGCSNLTSDHLKTLLENCPHLQKINLKETKITGAAFACNAPLEQLTEIDLSDCTQLTDSCLKTVFEKCPNLQKISLAHSEITEAAFAGIETLKHLTEISLSSCKVSDADLKTVLEKCPHLQKLTCIGAGITGAAFACNTTLEHLTEISFWGCKQLTDDHLKALLEKCPHLRKIDLTGTNITGEAFASLSLEHLTDINLSGCKQLTDDHLKTLLEKCPHLQKINISDTEITGAGFAGNRTLEDLTEINLLKCKKLTDAHLKTLLEKSPKIQKIKLAETEKITGVAFVSDVILEEIVEIDVSNSIEFREKYLNAIRQKYPKATILATFNR